MTEDLTKIFERHKYDRNIETKSKAWFQQQVTLLNGKRIVPNNLIRENRPTNNIVPGSLYLFQYDPKYKDELPYYDVYPLVFPFRKTADGFIGLNMHYLPTFYRVKLLSKLMTYVTNDKMDYTTRIRYSWSLIMAASKFNDAIPCVKQYLKDHVVSPMVKIKPQDWHTAMMLPVERFVGASKQVVWRESRKWHR